MKLARIFTGAILGLAAALAPVAPSHAATPQVCYEVFSGAAGGWDYACDGAMAGTTGQASPVIAIKFNTWDVGRKCARTHVRNVGWIPWVCGADTQVIELKYGGLQVEALQIELYDTSRVICGRAHVSNIGWLTATGNCTRLVTFGTTGRAESIEAIEISAYWSPSA